MEEYRLDQKVVTFESGQSYRAADAERRPTPCYSDQLVSTHFQMSPFSD